MRTEAAVVFVLVGALLAAGCGAEPEAPRGIRNVVLVSLDAVGARHVGAYGYARDTTPSFDAVAPYRGLFPSPPLFDRMPTYRTQGKRSLNFLSARRLSRSRMVPSRTMLR